MNHNDNCKGCSICNPATTLKERYNAFWKQIPTPATSIKDDFALFVRQELLALAEEVQKQEPAVHVAFNNNQMSASESNAAIAASRLAVQRIRSKADELK